MENTRHGSIQASGVSVSDRASLQIGHRSYFSDGSQIPPEQLRKLREDAVLASLAFPEMNVREASIEDSCEGTFEWIFQDEVERIHYSETPFTETETVHNPLPSWLSRHGGLFFISGKAGSGKSTLVRYLSTHERTTILLDAWAQQGHCKLVVATFFFWQFGGSTGELQRSYEGLWRAILYNIVKQHRSLIPVVLKSRLERRDAPLEHLRQQPWAKRDLRTALQALIDHVRDQQLRMCLFIDGLDEYVGEELALIEDFKLLFASPNIKICTSSRPRNLFESSFGISQQHWKLTLHEWTRPDIAEMVRVRLHDNRSFVALISNEEQRSYFVREINRRAEGVFLWAVLIVRELIREIAQYGTVRELEERLNSLPSELGGPSGLFQTIIERSDKRYQTYMARLLLLMQERGFLAVREAHLLYNWKDNPGFLFGQCLKLGENYRHPWQLRRSEKTRLENEDNEMTKQGTLVKRKADKLWRDGFCVLNPELWPAVPVRELQSWEYETSFRRCCNRRFATCSNGPPHPDDWHCGLKEAKLLEDTRLQIRKWCPDFVEVHEDDVRFVHKSIAEYLRLPEAQRLLDKLSGIAIEPWLANIHLQFVALHVFDYEDVDLLSDVLLLFSDISRHFECGRLQLPDLCLILDLCADMSATNAACASCSFLSSGDYPESLPFWIQPFDSYLPNYIPANFDCLTAKEENRAWLFGIACVSRQGFVKQAFGSVSASQRQGMGIVILYIMMILPQNRHGPFEQDMIETMIFTGLDLNSRQQWNSRFRLHDADPATFELSFWVVYTRWMPQLWGESEWHVETRLNGLALLLDIAPPNRHFRLPTGHRTLFSTVRFHPDLPLRGMSEKAESKKIWDERFKLELLTLLHIRGLLEDEDKTWAQKEGLMTDAGEMIDLPEGVKTYGVYRPTKYQQRA